MKTANLWTNKSWVASLGDLKQEFRKWGIVDYILPTKKESWNEVTISFVVNDKWVYPRCGAFNTPERNLRAIVLAVESARLAHQRGIGGLLAEITKYFLLPSGEKSAYGVLGVPEGTKDPFELRAAYLKRLKETHPDTGGREEDFLAVRQAAEKLGII